MPRGPSASLMMYSCSTHRDALAAAEVARASAHLGSSLRFCADRANGRRIPRACNGHDARTARWIGERHVGNHGGNEDSIEDVSCANRRLRK